MAGTGATSRVTLLHGIAKMLATHVRVDLCRRKIGVAEHCLDGAEVGPPLDQIRREGVAKDVRRYTRGVQPCLTRQSPYPLEKVLPRHRASGHPLAARVDV